MRKCDILVSSGTFSTVKACKPGINSSQGVSDSERRSAGKKSNYCLHWIFKVQHTHVCTNFTICFLVLSFELLRSEVAEAVVIKWVPRRLCRAGAVRSRNSGFCLALVLDSIISIKLNRLDDDWLRCKRSRETMKVL